MSRPKNSKEFRERLALKFIRLLSEKELHWKQGWLSDTPLNAVTQKNYRGINVLRLGLTAMEMRYDDPRWATMVQIMDKEKKYHPNESWHLKKGSKAAYVEYWYPIKFQYDGTIKREQAITWEQYKKEIKEGASALEYNFKATFTPVFNASQIEGIAPMKHEERHIEISDIVKDLSKNMNVPIIYEGNRAYYSPHSDEIHLPHPNQFFSEYEFQAAALHELAHSTGHPLRLNRNISNNPFGSADYAYEELVAEISSCFMGIHTEQTQEHIKNHKAYVQSWINHIQEKPESLIKAVADAQTAANYMEWKANLITQKEYENRKHSAFTASSEKIKQEAPQQTEKKKGKAMKL